MFKIEEEKIELFRQGEGAFLSLVLVRWKEDRLVSWSYSECTSTVPVWSMRIDSGFDALKTLRKTEDGRLLSVCYFGQKSFDSQASYDTVKDTPPL